VRLSRTEIEHANLDRPAAVVADRIEGEDVGSAGPQPVVEDSQQPLHAAHAQFARRTARHTAERAGNTRRDRIRHIEDEHRLAGCPPADVGASTGQGEARIHAAPAKVAMPNQREIPGKAGQSLLRLISFERRRRLFRRSVFWGYRPIHRSCSHERGRCARLTLVEPGRSGNWAGRLSTGQRPVSAAARRPEHAEHEGQYRAPPKHHCLRV
jgi:hypothetical protein